MSDTAHRFSETERAGVYRAIAERRDMRHFRPEPVDPAVLARLLAMPEGARPVAILCLGHAAAFYPAPMLALDGWTKRKPLQELVFHNTWGNTETIL